MVNTSAYGDCTVNVKSHNPLIFCSLRNCDAHLILQQLGKFDLEINITPIGLERYMSFTVNNKLSFVNNNFQFISSLLNSLVKNLGKDDFKYSSQEFENNILDLVKQKGFYPCEYMSDFEKFKKNC